VGIYDKTCPQCMASSRATATRCTCGYLFDASASDERSVTLERIAREEKLFEEYLEARLTQAKEVASVAAHTAELDPENRRKAIEALRANQVAAKTAAGLAKQRIKAAQAAHAAGLSFTMRRSLMPDEGSSTKQPPPTQPSSVSRPTTPRNGMTERPTVALRPKDRWTPKHDNNRTMPPLRRNDAAPHTQTVTSKFAAAAGSTLSLPLAPASSTAHRPADNKPPIPVLTMAVPQQALTPAPLRNNGVKVFESKMVFDGSPWRDAAKKMAAKAARRLAGAAAHGAKKAAKGIGQAASSGAKRAGRAAARGASKAAKHMAKAAAHTAKQAVHVVQRRRDAMKVRAARMSPALDLPPVVTTHLATPGSSPKPGVMVSGRRSATTTTRAKPATPKPSLPARAAKRSPSRMPAPPTKPGFLGARPVEAKQRAQPTDTFRAVQAAKIEKAVTAARGLERKLPASEIECALCSATLPANADHCLCGWRVPNHEREIPALDLAKSTARNGNELTVVFRKIECPSCSTTIAVNAKRCRCGWRVPEEVNELPPVSLSSEEISALSLGMELDEPSKLR
jgi:hypothetical protein